MDRAQHVTRGIKCSISLTGLLFNTGNSSCHPLASLSSAGSTLTSKAQLYMGTSKQSLAFKINHYWHYQILLDFNMSTMFFCCLYLCIFNAFLVFVTTPHRSQAIVELTCRASLWFLMSPLLALSYWHSTQNQTPIRVSLDILLSMRESSSRIH